MTTIGKALAWTRAHLAWVVCAFALLVAATALRTPGPVRGFDVVGFGKLPVLEGGRVKPADSIARNALLMIRGQQTFAYDPDGDGPERPRTIGADEWLLDVLFRPPVADRQPAFVINDPDVLGLMGMQQSSNRYFSFQQIGPYIEEIQKQAMAAEAKDAKQRTRFESAVLNLFQRVLLYHRLRNTVQYFDGQGLVMEVGLRGTPAGEARRAEMAQYAYFRPLLPAQGDAGWRTIAEALRGTGPVDPVLAHWARLSLGWTLQDPKNFNGALSALQVDASSLRPDLARHAEDEWLFNLAQPFYLGMVVYVLALLVLFASWLWRPEILRPVAFGFLLAGFVVHTAGLTSRIFLQGRPPVTNLYSSAVFVGWVGVLVAVILERLYRKGFGTLVAGAAGFATLLIAHHLSLDGDTMEMMRAVLDSNFWLATHVVAITVGYGGTYVAGLIAIVWIAMRLFGTADADSMKTLSRMAYGVVCFSVLFSFLGTVLGGIWADQSWGRFWGWDPKENGALLIVLWNAVILHARWGGFARDRGIMAMAVFGNVITSLSWFGVNMLGIGLHSYGFMDEAVWALLLFSLTQVAVIVAAYVRPRFWAARPTGDEPGSGRRASSPA